MTKTLKYLLSVIPVTAIVSLLLMIFGGKVFHLDVGFQWPMIFARSLQFLYICLLLFLLYRVWQYGNVKTGLKWSWTFNLVCFGPPAMLMYIWQFDDELAVINNPSKDDTTFYFEQEEE